MNEYFSEQKFWSTNVRVELGLSNYETKADLKNAAGVNTLDFAKKTDLVNLVKADLDKLDIHKFKNVPSGLSNLKSIVNQLDIGKIETPPVGLSKLSNVLKNDVAILKQVSLARKNDIADFVKKTDFDYKLKNLNKKLLQIKKNMHFLKLVWMNYEKMLKLYQQKYKQKIW